MIGCKRCGASCEGDIIVPALAFGFKHEAGCGHGVGPLAVLPGSYKAKTAEKHAEVQAEEVIKEVEKTVKEVEKNESRAERRRARQQKE